MLCLPRLILVAMLQLMLTLHPAAYAGFSAKERADAEDEHGLCGVAKRALQQTIENVQQEVGKGLPTKALLNNCARELTQYFDKCTSPERLAQYGCKKGDGTKQAAPTATPTSPATAPQGIPQAADKMAGGLVEDANCKRRVSQCLTQGGHKGDRHKITEKCMNGEPLSFSPVPNPTTPRDRDASARNELLFRIHQAQQNYESCLKKRAKDEEDLARKTLLDSQAARSDGSRPSLDCIDHDIGHRECQISKNGERFTPVDGQREDGPPRDPEADKYNPALVASDKSHCSGTVLGDGQTVVTAGHCLGDGRQEGERQITVRDSAGEQHVVTARCSGQYTDTTTSDLARCTLSQPIKANPVYFATYDPKVQGSGCVDEGYVKRCGSGFFENLTNKPVTVYGYPSNQGLTESKGTITGTGTNGWIFRNGVLYNNLICTGGCSGSGMFVDVGGQRVIVAPTAFGNRVMTPYGGAPVPSYRQWQGLRIQSISTEKLANSSLMFQQMQ